MITRTAISTISYNSEQFLIRELNKLIREDKIIEFYAFIYHYPEEDEKKPHRHLFVIPSSTVDTFSLNERLQQIDVQNPDKPPLGCISWCHSKFADWFLYSIHDRDYLASKCESRKFHYEKQEVVVSDWDYFNELIHRSDFSKYKAFAKFRDMISSGVNFRELFSNGFIPVQQIVQYKKAFNLLKYGNMDYAPNITDRAGLSGHEMDVHLGAEMPFKFNEDGEIISDDIDFNA